MTLKVAHKATFEHARDVIALCSFEIVKNNAKSNPDCGKSKYLTESGFCPTAESRLNADHL